MRVFDYLYYRAHRFYLKTEKVPPELSAISLVSLMQLLHILSFFLLLSVFVKKKVMVGKLIVVVIFIIISIFNYKRYVKNKRFERLNSIFKYDINVIRNGWLLMTYMILNLALVFSLAIYIGNHKDW